jgi:hypothetical protein
MLPEVESSKPSAIVIPDAEDLICVTDHDGEHHSNGSIFTTRDIYDCNNCFMCQCINGVAYGGFCTLMWCSSMESDRNKSEYGAFSIGESRIRRSASLLEECKTCK